ncbi:MAG: hypothetical protein J3R72DRAFT_494111 [Linnemannia gamsii]|nr:MAG: hypothetical protein J3R72DRAFT_494111 [Linnemannia gamsii]
MNGPGSGNLQPVAIPLYTTDSGFIYQPLPRRPRRLFLPSHQQYPPPPRLLLENIFICSNSNSSSSSNRGRGRIQNLRFQQGSLGTAAATTPKSKTGTTSTEILLAELVQLNTGIVYENLDDCMIRRIRLGYPVMPSWTC